MKTKMLSSSITTHHFEVNTRKGIMLNVANLTFNEHLTFNLTKDKDVPGSNHFLDCFLF